MSKQTSEVDRPVIFHVVFLSFGVAGQNMYQRRTDNKQIFVKATAIVNAQTESCQSGMQPQAKVRLPNPNQNLE